MGCFILLGWCFCLSMFFVGVKFVTLGSGVLCVFVGFVIFLVFVCYDVCALCGVVALVDYSYLECG